MRRIMSHVSALPNASPSLDASAAEAAHYALQAFSGGIQDVDAMDAAVVAVGAVAVGRLIYQAFQNPGLRRGLASLARLWAPLKSLFGRSKL